MESITIYWTLVSEPNRHTMMNLLWEPPKPLLTVLPPGDTANPKGSYRLCSGAQSIFKNTYVLTHPLTSSVSVEGPVDKPTIKDSSGPWSAVSPALKNRYRVEYDYSWAFFCEESVLMQVTPPYMHNTSDKEGGMISSGSMDISRWFRHINLTYILWEGKDTLTVTEGDPAIYLQFFTDKKIVLKQFECTPEVLSMARQVVNSSSFSHLEPLKDRYLRFTRSNRHKRLLNLIKQNTLD